jgi:hypothetical protein
MAILMDFSPKKSFIPLHYISFVIVMQDFTPKKALPSRDLMYKKSNSLLDVIMLLQMMNA